MEFKPTGFSLDIFKERYAFTEEETFKEACKRVARQVSIAETPDKQSKYEEKFFNILNSNVFVPGGRIWYNSGRNKPQLLNCFVLENSIDSKEGWGELAKEMIITSMHGGGAGICFSDIRPKGSIINGQKGECPGPLELMKLINNCAAPIKAGGLRRVALMFSLDLNHPDIMEFLDTKLKDGELSFANISVKCHNTTEFIKAVKEGGDYELSWKGKYKKSINAKKLWDKIVKNAYKNAEPGFLNWELVEKESNIHYIEKLVNTNPCVSGDTEILTDSGYKRIDSVVGSKVNVWNGFEFSEVIPNITGTNQKMKTVKLSNGVDLKTTNGHKWVLSVDYHGTTKRVTTAELRVGDKLIKHEFPVIEHGESVNDRESYSQGFYSADVDLYINKKLNIKNFVPFGWNLKSRLSWLAGLFDGGGCELKEGGLQLAYANIGFLKDLQKMLTTCGIASKVVVASKEGIKQISNGKVRELEGFYYKESNRIYIGADSIQRLVEMGMKCERLKFNKYPNKNDSRFVTVIAIEDSGIEEKVYCFTEYKRHMGCFNGVVTANCGEIALSAHDCCCLGHLVLPRFIDNGKIDYHLLGDTIRTGVRFLDNVLDVNHYPMPKMKNKSNRLRRIGIGTTGLADMLALLGLAYGSEDSNKLIDKLYRFISKVAYESSVMLSIEKGAFPAYDPSEHLKSDFMKRMPKKIKSLISENGIRNCALLTQAPTGTVSILSGNVSSGIEPMFAPAYERRYFVKNERKTELVFHPLFFDFMENGKSVDHFIGSRDISVKQHMEIQKTIQKHIDNAVSKTINMKSNFPMKEMSDTWLKYLPYLKGTTFFRENSRGYVDEDGNIQEPPLKAISLEDAKKRYTKDSKTEVKEQLINDCPNGLCELS